MNGPLLALALFARPPHARCPLCPPLRASTALLRPRSMMLAMFLVSLVAALVLCCLLFPSMWATMACDEILDAHEAGLALVSTRESCLPPPNDV